MEKQNKRMNIKYVAEVANVSTATVSRVLNQTGYVKKETKDHVKKVIRELGFRRNSIAKSLRSRQSKYIALIVPDIENEYFAVLSRWIEHNLQTYGYGVFISSTEQSQSKAKWYANLYVDHFVAGAILLMDDDDVIKTFTQANIPVIVADRLEDKKASADVSFIGSDNFNGGYLAAKTLIRHGARSLLILRDKQNLTNVNERQEGFLKAVKDSQDNQIQVEIFPIEVNRNKIFNQIYSIYQKSLFDGLFATSDYIAIPAMGGLIQQGLAVPEDIQIIGYDGIPSASFLSPTLATITQSLDEVGAYITNVIKQMIEDKNYRIDYTFPVMLQDGSTLKKKNDMEDR